MKLELLTNTAHSNPVCTYEDQFLFAKGTNIVLSDNPGLETIFGCPAIRVGWSKRPWNESEIWWQNTYNNGKPQDHENKIWCVYSVDWSQFSGDFIPGTLLLEGGCVSSNNLSDASIYRFAVDAAKNEVVSYMSTSYWVSDRDDVPEWRKALFNKYPNPKLAMSVE